MTDGADALIAVLDSLSEDKRALLAELLRPGPEPIAVVGMGCRFPSAHSLSHFAALLARGQDGICEIPKDRWDIDEHYDPDPDAAGKMNTRWGGFLEDVAHFDAAFFEIKRGRNARKKIVNFGLSKLMAIALVMIWTAPVSEFFLPNSIAPASRHIFQAR